MRVVQFSGRWDRARLGRILTRVIGKLTAAAKEEGDEEWHDRQHVHHVHPVLEEGPLLGGPGQPDEVLEGEPGDADGLDLKSLSMCRFGNDLFNPTINQFSEKGLDHVQVGVVYGVALAILVLQAGKGADGHTHN